MSGALGANLSVEVGATDVTIAGITMGGTSGAVTTDIVSTDGGRLVFDNGYAFPGTADADADKDIDLADLMFWQRGHGMIDQENKINGDFNLDTVVDGDDLAIWQSEIGQPGMNGAINNKGRGFVESQGVEGSVNRISANVFLNDDPLDIKGTRDLVIDGNIAHEGTPSGLAPPDLPYTYDTTISNLIPGGTVTINGNIVLNNDSDGQAGEMTFNGNGDSQGTMIINGVISDGATAGNESGVRLGVYATDVVQPLNTIRITAANTYRGSTIIQRANVEFTNDAAFGTGTIRQAGPSSVYGYNLVPIGDRTLDNNLVLAQWQTVKGNSNLELTGNITQTNNRGLINQLDAGSTLTLSGRIDIWEDDEMGSVRRFVIDGEGTTKLTGIIRDIPDLDPDGNPWSFPGEANEIRKSGTGVLIIDMEAGDNDHDGPTRVTMGNMHYADNDSLNAGAGLIQASGGAVGVDTGVANNATFMAKLDSGSTGGLMLAASEAAANLDFTGAMANAAGMTVAAPETGLTYTGTITPANNTYGLGGGTGTITLPNAQLTGPNDVSIRNGGTVELLGDNTYTGSTTIITKYTSSAQRLAEEDSDGTEAFYDTVVAPILVVDDLADGGVASSIGASSNAAENLFIQGSTLKYVGTGDSTDRLFTIGTGGATIDASGSGALVFSNTGTLGRDDAESRTGSLRGGAPDYNANVIYLLPDTSDLVVGMTVIDPDSTGYIQGGGCTGGAYCIPQVDDEGQPDPTTIDGVSGSSVGMSTSTAPDVIKVFTRIVFGSVERTITLTGTNTGDNIMAPVISDSEGFPLEPDVAVDPGAVSLLKTGSGKWILTGSNTYSGDTMIEEGILSITNAYLDDNSAVELSSSAVFDLDFVGSDSIKELFIDDVSQAIGTWGALGSGADFESSLFTGTGLLNVLGAPVSALASVPEPCALSLAALACFVGCIRRRRIV